MILSGNASIAGVNYHSFKVEFDGLNVSHTPIMRDDAIHALEDALRTIFAEVEDNENNFYDCFDVIQSIVRDQLQPCQFEF